MNLRTALTATLFVGAVAIAAAQVKTYTVSPTSAGKATQAFTFTSNTDVENIVGQTANVDGTIRFDAAKRTGGGRLAIDLASVDTGIPLRNEHLRAPNWIDTGKFPKAVFEATSVKHKSGDEYTVTGKLTFHGVTKPLTTVVTLKHLKASDATRAAGFKGDAVNLKTSFKLRLADFGVTIQPQARGKVAEVITVALNVFGEAK